jgi:hypothetical protein
MSDPNVSDPGVTLPAVTTPADQNRSGNEALHDFDRDHDCIAEGCNVDAGFERGTTDVVPAGSPQRDYTLRLTPDDDADVPTRLYGPDPASDMAWWQDPDDGPREMPTPEVTPHAVPDDAAEVIAEVAAGPDVADAPGAGEISLIQFGDPDRVPESPSIADAIDWVYRALVGAGYGPPHTVADIVRRAAADMGVDLNG